MHGNLHVVFTVMDLQQQAAHNGMKCGQWSSASGSTGHALTALINESCARFIVQGLVVPLIF